MNGSERLREHARMLGLLTGIPNTTAQEQESIATLAVDLGDALRSILEGDLLIERHARKVLARLDAWGQE